MKYSRNMRMRKQTNTSSNVSMWKKEKKLGSNNSLDSEVNKNILNINAMNFTINMATIVLNLSFIISAFLSRQNVISCLAIVQWNGNFLFCVTWSQQKCTYF